MDFVRLVGLLREGVSTNLWGLGCPLHCHPTSLTALALSLTVGWILGLLTALYLCFRLGFFIVPDLSSSEPSVPRPAHRLQGYLNAPPQPPSSRR